MGPSSNKPAAIIMSDDYRGYAESDEDFALYFEAVERMNRDDGTRLTMGEVFGSGYRSVDDGFDPELDWCHEGREGVPRVEWRSLHVVALSV